MRAHLLLLLTSFFSLAQAHKTAKQELVVVAKEVESPLWRSTLQPPAPLPFLLPKMQDPQLAFSTHHRTSLATLGHHLTPAPLRNFAAEELTKVKLPCSPEDFFDNIASHARALSMQEHSCSGTFAHTLRDGNWLLTFVVGAGATMRHFWLADPHRAAVLDSAKIFKKDSEKKRSILPKTNRSPRLPLTPWHGQAGTAGLLDTLCTIAYDFPVKPLTLRCGVQVLAPSGTQPRQRVTTSDTDPLPLDAQSFALRAVNRLRDILLVPSLTNGHWGLGMTGQLEVPFGSRWHLVSGCSVMQPLPAEQIRYQLVSQDEAVPFLFEGISGTEVGISPDSDIDLHLRQHIYPATNKMVVFPGTLLHGQAGLAYDNGRWRGALLYHGRWQSSDHAGDMPRTDHRQSHTLELQFSRASCSALNINSWHISLRIPLARAGDGHYWGISFGIRE